MGFVIETPLADNGDNMARKGMRRNLVSTGKKLDADDELRISLKPFLAILGVMWR